MVMVIHLLPPPATTTIIRLLCLVLICLLPLLCSGISSLNVSNCPEHERQALLDMIQYDDGHPMYEDHGFLADSWVVGTNCCQWYGIACDRRTGHVVRIDLRHSLQDDDYEFNLVRSLLAVKHLRYLDLSGNRIHTDTVTEGLGIPSFIGLFQNLRYLNLSFTYNDGFGGRNVPHQLGNLSRLHTLSLCCTQIDDPHWLSHLTSLQQIELRYLDMGAGWVQALGLLPSIRAIRVTTTSGIPSSLNPLNFTNLSVLDLSNTEIENSTMPSWLSSLTRLQYLRLSNCNLRGEAIWNLSSYLEVLDLSLNQLQGSIPDTLGGLSMLRELVLSENNFSGSVPQSLGHLSRLVYLTLGYNSLTGSLTESHFANLSSLKHLVVSSMNSPITLNVSSDWQPPFHLQALLMGSCRVVGGRFPYWLRTQLQSLSVLGMSNTGIQDFVPPWFWIDNRIVYLNLSHNAIFGYLPEMLHSPRLETIDLNSNHMHGPLPQQFIVLNLVFLDLSNNSFSGPISNIETFNLTYLLLSKNNFTGKVPTFICRLNLLILDLSHNHLTGELPDCHHPIFFLAGILDLSDNNLSGRIPDNLGTHDCGLFSLYLSNNNFSGELPSSLSKCKNLRVLDLEFTDNITIWLGDSFTNFRTLRLRSNNFYGFLPPMLSHHMDLKILDLSYNNLSGTIPQSFGSFPSMKRLNVPGYNDAFNHFTDKVLLWMKGKERTYDKLLQLVVAIDLSHNDLSGTIPEQLANLILLKSLDLSNNYLIGEITIKIGQMQQLESLDLSYNRLSGPIPSSLANLSYLGYLDLSYNNLSGRIPTGGHLDTFQDPSVYRGNPFLDSTNVKHGGDTIIEGASVGENTDEDTDEKFWLYNGIAPGFVVGIWAVLGPLLFKKTWRYAYFQAMDTMRDKLF